MGVLVLTAAVTSEAAEDRLPTTVYVQVGFDVPTQGARHREDVEAALLSELRLRGCFAAIQALPPAEKPPEAGLMLRVRLSDLREETRHDLSVAQMAQPAEPSQTLRYVVEISAAVEFDLVVLPAGTAVRDGGFRQVSARQPRMLGEDTWQAANDEMIREIARRVARAVCRGSMRKLARDIDAVSR